MNFASINELDWGADSKKWEKEIKPQIVSQIRDLKQVLSLGTEKRKLAWSTLLEYMNFPLDNPSSNSIYAVKARRIMELAKEENLPVFIPLNGFQWWDELPELYNWWDEDGTKTPQIFFERQKTPDFKERFIKGYNPDNIWNVDWQNYSLPMNLNHRDWGGGDFYLAPAPNIYDHQRTNLNYYKVLIGRLKVIVEEINKILNNWEKEGSTDLFAGLSIGTEVSLNTSLTSSDFSPYGFRAIQDFLCGQDDPKCGENEKFPSEKLNSTRREILEDYFIKTTKMITELGIPKQRIYTHVWGERQEWENDYVGYPISAVNLFSRPGMSFYGFSKNPLELLVWKDTLQTNGSPFWGAVEYSAEKTIEDWSLGLKNTFENGLVPAKIMVIYNWREHKNTPAVDALNTFLQKPADQTGCYLPEIILSDSNLKIDPSKISWKYLGSLDSANIQNIYIRFGNNKLTKLSDPILFSYQITSASTQFMLLEKLNPGLYTWYLEIQGCEEMKRQYSLPQRTAILYKIFSDETPAWVKFMLSIEDRLKRLLPF